MSRRTAWSEEVSEPFSSLRPVEKMVRRLVPMKVPDGVEGVDMDERMLRWSAALSAQNGHVGEQLRKTKAILVKRSRRSVQASSRKVSAMGLS